MRNRRLHLLLLPIILICLNGAFPAATAQAEPRFIEGTDPAAKMFNPSEVNKFTLKMSTADFDSLKRPNVAWDVEGPWRAATLNAVIAGKNYGPMKVGVHLKGAYGSWRDVTEKAGFKIKIDAFVSKQTLLGLVKITLNNMVQDPSYIHEPMTYKLMRDLGVPAPRAGYANVFLNGINYGLHLNVETIDPIFLARWGITSNHLYKGGLPSLPDFYPGYERSYSIESGSESNISDLTAFVEANQNDGDQWWEAVSKLADMNELTLVWASELYAGHWDGYTVNRNNYYINFDNNGKAILLSWGTDQTWNSGYDYFSFNGLLAQKCMTSTKCHELYLQTLAKVAKTAKATNLYVYGSDIALSIMDAIGQDPWHNFGDARAYQEGAINQASAQLAYLQNMVVPWDTTAGSVTINHKSYSSEAVAYLAPGTTNAEIAVVPTQPDATSESIKTQLVSGINNIQATITSADGLHSNILDLSVYVLSQRKTSAKINFKFGKADVSPSGATSLTGIMDKLYSAKNMELTLTLPKSQSKTINDKRASVILKKFNNQGFSPTKLTKLYSGSNKDQVLVSVSYQN